MTTAAPEYDLRSLVRRVGSGSYSQLSFPEQRKEATEGVELLEDDGPVQVRANPIPVTAFIDGIQNQMILTYRGHRPITLAYVAAGAATQGPRLCGVEERLSLVSSAVDTDWIAEVNTDPAVPHASVAASSPPEVAAAVVERVQMMRSQVEIQLRTRILQEASHNKVIVLDGSLQGAENDMRLVGVVKTSRTQYLTDEGSLYGLPFGYRSAIFKIPGRAGTSERFSCYVRLHSAQTREWSFGLIRLESFYPEVLDALAARALAERQGPGSGDGRYDRHLGSVAACEKLLRARRPMAFDLMNGPGH